MKYLITEDQHKRIKKGHTGKILRVLSYLNDQDFKVEDDFIPGANVTKIIYQPRNIGGTEVLSSVAFLDFSGNLVITQRFFDKLTDMFSLNSVESNIVFKEWVKKLFGGKEIKMFYTSD